MNGEFTKYNNNFGWADNDTSVLSKLAQAFSHYSWQYTKGFMIVVDI